MKRIASAAAALLALGLTSAALAAGGPGKFQTTLSGTGPKTEHGALDGTWTIDLSSPTSGKVGLTWDGMHHGGGRYVISGSKIELTPKQGGKCTTVGKYRFKVSAGTLTFKTIRDSCTTRRDVLTAHPWTRVG